MRAESGENKYKIILDRVSKKINGRIILNDISLQMESGYIYGICGRNGSGKTMLFRAISGLMRIDSGTIYVNGKLLHRDFEVIPNLGIILEKSGFYYDMNGMENLKYLASFKKIINMEDIVESLRRVGLDPFDKRSYGKYSMGMKQRLAIAQAIMESPDIILLDEPTNGLDEEGVLKIRNIILEEKQRGALIMIASHNKEDIGLLCDKIYNISAGRLVY